MKAAGKRKWIESPAPELRLPDLEGRVAVVTGATMGLGKAVTEALLRNGSRVFGLARHTDSGPDHPLFAFLPVDLTDVRAIRGAFRKISSQTPALDYVVNIAGEDPKYAIDEITAGQWDHLVDLNLRAYYFVIQQAMPLLRRGFGRSIVNVSSINYRLGIPGRAPYSATKAGILGLTTGLSRELGEEGIRVNTVTPGWIFTERQIEEYFKGRPGARRLRFLESQQALKIKITPQDVANHILFYLSQASRASVSHNCVVDGGWLLE